MNAMDESSTSSSGLYLGLIKKALSYALWDEFGSPIETFNYRRPFFKRKLVTLIVDALRRRNLQLLRIERYSEADREMGNIYPINAHTLIGLKRLDNIQHCIENVLKDGVAGDFIETGVWRGGACIFMRAVLAAYKVKDRRVFVADSFQGLPAPDEFCLQDAGDKLYTEDYLRVPLEQVKRNFEKYGLLDDQVIFLKGWFKDTLPKAPIDKLAVMRLDGDMYQSTMDGLVNLYPKLQRGGYCIIDDYNAHGCACKQAVDDYRKQHTISAEIRVIDKFGVFWKRSD